MAGGHHLAKATADGPGEITDDYDPHANGDPAPRVVKRKMPGFGVKRDGHPDNPRPTKSQSTP
jgi:hypothetical protein